MIFKYTRRSTTPAHVGNQIIGGEAPILVQSMANVDTNDINAGIAQAMRIADAGGQMVRFTAQGTRESRALAGIRAGLTQRGYNIPLVADIHFNTRAAYEAALHVEKVRINPGNFYDAAKKFESIDYTDEEYAEEVRALQNSFRDFVTHCRTHGRAIRIGVNHGSLSDRIMSRYGDTPEGMVQSCIEFLSVCVEKNFTDVVISIKASNPLVMVQTVQMLVRHMEAEGMAFPLHLGVTEAGDGEDGRIKSAVGIGTLLGQGIGDTIRVSLSEDPEAEIPVAVLLRSCAEHLEGTPAISVNEPLPQPFRNAKTPLVLVDADDSLDSLPEDERPDIVMIDNADQPNNCGRKVLGNNDIRIITDHEALTTTDWSTDDKPLIIRLTHPNIPAMLRAIDAYVPCAYYLHLSIDAPAHELPTRYGFLLGEALLRGQSSGIYLHSPSVSGAELAHIAFGLLQASRRRITRTEYISCPSCGRTLFGLQDTVARIKAATSHLKGLKIGVMGCIVNGPGEMADADYGYVGSAPGKVDLYKQKTKLKRNIPQENAVEELIELIKANGDWQQNEL